MEFQIQIENIEEIAENFERAPSIAAPILQRALSASQAILAKYTTKETVPWRTGFLTQSFRAQFAAGVLRWFPTADYASFVEFGTKPHVIEPKNKKALYWQGADHPVKRVNHPGTKANPFMERIIEAATPDITTTFGTALQQIVSAIAAQGV